MHSILQMKATVWIVCVVERTHCLVYVKDKLLYISFVWLWFLFQFKMLFSYTYLYKHTYQWAGRHTNL